MDKLEALEKLGGGHFLDALLEALGQVSEAVTATGKPGTVSVALKISHPKGGAQRMVTVEESIGTRMPKRDPFGAFYFVEKGQLYRDDPSQVAMDISDAKVLDDVGIEKREVRE